LTQRHTPLSQDAALVVALAGTAMPFAHSAEDEAERWLRALRLHGQVGAALQSLGVGEASLMPNPDAEHDSPATPPKGGDVLDEVTRRAGGFAVARDAETVGTPDLLFAVFDIYGELFDRVLYLRGTSREELTERLAGASERHPTEG
jgi:hypothetical protein